MCWGKMEDHMFFIQQVERSNLRNFISGYTLLFKPGTQGHECQEV